MRRPGPGALATVALLLALVGCSRDAEPAGRDGDASPSQPSGRSSDPPPVEDGGSGGTGGSGGSAGGGAGQTLPPVETRPSLPGLMRTDWGSTRIRYGEVLAQTDAYTRYAVTYDSGDLTISGVLLRPTGRGPFPGVVLNHGYIDPATYVTGQGLAREQDYLARQGFAVLHTDYRGHAASDDTTPLDLELRLGYAADSINAVHALRREPWVDADRMGMLGRSMGGGVTLSALVTEPDVVDAAVVYASVSSRFTDNLDQFTVPGRPEAAQSLYDRFGTPADEPDFYEQLSPRTFFDRVEAPVLSLHGEVDDTCPPVWADATQRLLERAGADGRLFTYPGEGHTFYGAWLASIERSVAFLRRELG